MPFADFKIHQCNGQTKPLRSPSNFSIGLRIQIKYGTSHCERSGMGFCGWHF